MKSPVADLGDVGAGAAVEASARTSEDRKPGPGMANAAASALNLDLTASWVVGDRPEDIGFAEAVGAWAIYLGTGDYRHT